MLFFFQLNFPFYLLLMSSYSVFGVFVFVSWSVVFIFFLHLNLPLSRIDVFIFLLLLNLRSCLELTPSSSFVSWNFLCIWNWYLRLLFTVHLIFVPRIDVFVLSSVELRISNWCLHLFSSVELILVSRFDVFIFFLQLILSLYPELMFSSSHFSWTSFLHWTYLYISYRCPYLLSSAELVFVSRILAFIFFLHLNLPFVSRIQVVIFCFQLNLSLHLE